jgi:hypothetical protein
MAQRQVFFQDRAKVPDQTGLSEGFDCLGPLNTSETVTIGASAERNLLGCVGGPDLDRYARVLSCKLHLERK